MSQPSDIDSNEAPSGLVRHLGLIKALAIIMAVLIVAALVVIVVTIYSRLQAGVGSSAPAEISVAIPADATVRAATADKAGTVLVIDLPEGQQVWHLKPNGQIRRKLIMQAE